MTLNNSEGGVRRINPIPTKTLFHKPAFKTLHSSTFHEEKALVEK